MIERYSREEMSKIWELNSKFKYYLDVELAVCRAYNKLGQISQSVLDDIISKASFSVDRIDEIEKEVHHDLIAFLTNVNENVGENSRYIHMGMTSSDVIDTALALQMQDAGKIILKDLDNLIAAIKEKAKEHKTTICIGRSHGVHAEPMTFGVKLCGWIDLFERNKRNFEKALEESKVGQISGPVGTYSNISPEIEKIACEFLNLKPAKFSTQVIARDIHAQYHQALALIASVIEQVAVELRHLQRTEVLEVEEGFSKGQKGSSAMPHKKNPISGENLSGLARVVRSNSVAAMENIPLWHERDISHSSVERIIFPDSTILIDYMLSRLERTIKNLVVHNDNMLKNTKLFGGIVFSQKVLLKLCSKGLLREDAYKIVQRNALDAFNNNGSFIDNLMNDKDVLSKLNKEEIESCFDINDYLHNIDEIYKRFGI
ncbi:TPA: adenylosuccinate lyase [Candidatus Avigastranaerophilus faecigallinarum]|nr:adenylosuccinate lyase [Candidatus Avigastranaerophilus faecigallinarum]